MRIAQVSPLYESVPPRLYGGTERVVHYLTEELVKQGHDVTLFASGDSVTSARLVPARPTALRLNPEDCIDPAAAHAVMYEQLARRVEAGEFDVVHIHSDQGVWPILRRLDAPHLTTLHGRLDIPGLRYLFAEFSEVPVVSISNDQRRPLPTVNWQGTVYHGLPEDLYTPGPGDGGYLAFLGRMSPEKRPDLAIEIAERVGIPLKMAAKVDGPDRQYFREVIEPRLQRSPYAEFVGEINDREKNEFLGKAMALLFPIDWPEPFGLTMIESLACGTPVIAFDRGSVSEVLRNGISGFIVDSVDAAARAVESVPQLCRNDARAEFEQRFSARRMASDYLAVYRRLVAKGTRPTIPATRRLAAV